MSIVASLMLLSRHHCATDIPTGRLSHALISSAQRWYRSCLVKVTDLLLMRYPPLRTLYILCEVSIYYEDYLKWTRVKAEYSLWSIYLNSVTHYNIKTARILSYPGLYPLYCLLVFKVSLTWGTLYIKPRCVIKEYIIHIFNIWKGLPKEVALQIIAVALFIITFSQVRISPHNCWLAYSFITIYLTKCHWFGFQNGSNIINGKHIAIGYAYRNNATGDVSIYKP